MRIENQSHGPVAEDGGPGDHLNVAIKPAEVLDHRLVIAEHVVHHEAVMPVLGFDHHNLLAFRPGGIHLEVLAEPDVGNDFAAHTGEVFAVRVEDVLAAQFDAFQTVGQGQHEVGVADADQQPVDNRQGERKAERDQKPLSRLTGDFDGSAQRVDASPDYIHAHATPGHLRHLPRHGEARRQDEREDLCLRQPGGAVDQALLDGAGAYGLRIQAASVVGYLDRSEEHTSEL